MHSDTQALFPNLEYLGRATSFAEEITLTLSAAPAFSEFDSNDFASLCNYLECFGAPSGITLIKEGDPGDYILFVLTGSVNVLKDGPDGTAHLLANIGPGGSLGELSFIDGEARFANCVTTVPTDFAVLTRKDLHEMIINSPRIGNRFQRMMLQAMATRLRETSVSYVKSDSGVSV